MTSSPPITVDGGDPLAEAVTAELLLWDKTTPHRSVWLSVRDDAVRRAVAAGHGVDEIAAALRLLPADIERILTRTGAAADR